MDGKTRPPRPSTKKAGAVPQAAVQDNRPKLKGNLTDLPNIGRTTAAKMEKIGIRTKEDFLKRDPYDVFHALRKKVDPTLCRCALAGLVGAKTGKPWHLVTKKTALEYEKRHPRHKWGPC